MAKEKIFVSLVVAILLVVLASASSTSKHQEEEEEADRITALPGQPKVSFQQFSGYVTVNEVAGRALFYWLTEAVDDPLSKPLVVWLNGGRPQTTYQRRGVLGAVKDGQITRVASLDSGNNNITMTQLINYYLHVQNSKPMIHGVTIKGPGCSSVAYGASEEIGPFRINKTSSGLYLNKFSWNKLANLLFLETPAGVGFSYSNRSSDLLDTGDRRTAEDSLKFLIRWMERFPRYKKREVYITGESYAGHYVPQLASAIVNYNAKSKDPINLKGFMVGNAVTDNYYDNLGTVTYWWSHAMISDKTYYQLVNICDFRRHKESNECESLYYYAMDKEFGNIDQYNIYAPPCNNSDGSRTTRRTMQLPHQPYPMFRQLSGYDPCTEKYSEVYYNRPDVQKALHANTTGIPYKWTACSDTLNRNWNDTDSSVLPIYRELIAAGLRIWVFSGDVDSVVPVTATRYALAQLKLATDVPWYPWYVKKQVGGWTEVYKGLTFATVRGAGHEVPLFKPRAALQLLKSFLAGQPLPVS